MGIKTIKSGNGLSGAGLGHPLSMGATGPGGSFQGRTMPQDTGRTNISTNGKEVGEVGSKKVPGNVGIKNRETGGMSRKGKGGVGYFKAKGTN